MTRSCARPGCSRSAVATLAYDYAGGVVELDDLAAEAHPMVHDLCGSHAASVRVPRGWELVDRWSAPEPGRTGDDALPGRFDLVGA